MTEAWTAWGERVEKRMSAQRATVENLATSLRQQLAKERAERIKLERELAMLKAELSTTRKLDDIMSRLDKIESSPSRGAGLRAVAT